jgi:hypothetical protein
MVYNYRMVFYYIYNIFIRMMLFYFNHFYVIFMPLIDLLILIYYIFIIL